MFGSIRSNKLQRAGQLAAYAFLVGFGVAAITVLHGLGNHRWLQVPWNELPAWIETAPVEDVVAALLRSVALVIAYWIAGSTVIYTAARLTKMPALVRATARTTLPQIRRVVDRAIAVPVTTAALSAPLSPALGADLANQAPTPPETIVYQISDQGVPIPQNLESPESTLIVPPGVDGAGYTPRPAGGVNMGQDLGVPAEAISYQVVAGDNLWTIAAHHLTAVSTEQDVDVAETVVYWRRVIEANTPRLRSGDPNLIYPGETIVLPAIDQGGTS